MCQCNCSEIQGHIALQVGSAFVNVDGYYGCKECAPLVGIDVSVFTKQGAKDFLDYPRLEIPKVTPDDYGGPRGARVACFELFSIEDLADAFAAEGVPVPGEGEDRYESWRDFMSDYGINIIHRAAGICSDRKNAKPEAQSK